MFGKNLKELRLEKNINQSEFAKIINISPSAIGMYERNQRFPDKDILIKIADYFEASVDYLLGRTTERNVHQNKAKLDQGVKTTAAHRININENLPNSAIEKINEYIRLVELDYKNKEK